MAGALMQQDAGYNGRQIRDPESPGPTIQLARLDDIPNSITFLSSPGRGMADGLAAGRERALALLNLGTLARALPAGVPSWRCSDAAITRRRTFTEAVKEACNFWFKLITEFS